MVSDRRAFGFLIAGLTLARSVNAFAVCPLLGPNFPPPKSITSSAVVKNATAELSKTFDDAMKSGDLLDNAITPNTTSFSVALFTIPQQGDNSSAQDPFFYQYHYTAPSFNNGTGKRQTIDSTSVYRIGTLTQVFNVWALLVNNGEQYLNRPITDFVPELAQAAAKCSAAQNPVECVDWCQVTLRDLGSHLSGIGRDYGFGDLAGEQLPIASNNQTAAPACGLTSSCSRAQFFAGFTERAPVYAPGTTPIFSDAAFQILGYALENITGKSFSDTFHDSIISPLKLDSFSFTKPADNASSVLANGNSWGTDLGDASSSQGLYTNLRDLATAGQAMLSSRLLTPAQTRRWLKPVTLTSNLVNTNGMPWQIYSATIEGNAPIIDSYTYLGSIGAYSSYLGLVPNYNVGFAILAADSTGSAPDLNAHADAIANLVPSLEKLAATEALTNHAGIYTDKSGGKLSIEPKYNSSGLHVLSFTGSNGTDLMAEIAKLSGFDGGAGALSFRLFPTNLATDDTMAFRAVYQNYNEHEDAGTPTCVTWMDVDGLVYKGKALDLFVFRYEGGKAVGLETPGFNLNLTRMGS